jgi:hypothetical protein
MCVPLLKIMKANSTQDALFPAISGSSQISLSPGETVRGNVSVDSVECCDQVNGRIEIVFAISNLPANSWQLTFTESRLTFLTPYIGSLLGNKAKLKSGSVSGGHIFYQNIAGLRLGNPQNDWPFLCVVCGRMDGITTNFLIKAQRPALQAITQSLAQCISEYWTRQNFLNEDLRNEITKMAQYDWNHFSEKDEMINLSFARVERVHDSLMSAN